MRRLIAPVFVLFVSPLVGRAEDRIAPVAFAPVHEGFAVPAESPTPGTVVPRVPPADLVELPPTARPDLDGVRWLPGYWHWDAEQAGYVWISGCWRVPPAGRVWLPGAWHDVRGGWQWSPGFWHTGGAVEYLPPPPAAIAEDHGEPPTADSHIVPGSWAWPGMYVWTPGHWARHQTDRVWVPTRFVPTPAGSVRVAGHWDHPLARRGIAFAPVAVPNAVAGARGFAFTPTMAIPADRMIGSLYVRNGAGAYFVGDSTGSAHARAGYSPFCGSTRVSNFAVAATGPAPTADADPLWASLEFAHRSDPSWAEGVRAGYDRRAAGSPTCDPAVPLTDLDGLTPLSEAARQAELALSHDRQATGTHRRRTEADLVARHRGPTDRFVRVEIDLPAADLANAARTPAAPPPTAVVAELRADVPPTIPNAVDTPAIPTIPPAVTIPVTPTPPPATAVVAPVVPTPPVPSTPRAEFAAVSAPKVQSEVPTVAATTKPAPDAIAGADVATPKASPEPPTPVRAELPLPPPLSMVVPNRPTGP